MDIEEDMANDMMDNAVVVVNQNDANANEILMSSVQQDVYKISTMKKLQIVTLVFNWYYCKLESGGAFVVDTGKSSTQNKSKIVNTIMPLIIKLATTEELTALRAPRPGPDENQNPWRMSLEATSKVVVAQFKQSLFLEEIKYGLIEEGSKDKKGMTVSAVETRIADLKRAKAAKSQKSMAAIYGDSTSSSSSSSTKTSKIDKKQSGGNSKKGGRGGKGALSSGIKRK